MAPEQIQNRKIDVRTDIYALGITLYQMLSGHVPFDSDSDFQIMNDHINAAPPPLAHMYPYAPVQYQSVVMKALEKSPEQRFQTVEEFGAALEHPESVPVSIATASMPAAPGLTVVEMPHAPLAAAAAVAPAMVPAPAAAKPQTQPEQASGAMAQPAAMPSPRFTWNSRYAAAAAIAVVGGMLLIVLLLARKPVAVQPVVVAPASSMESSSPFPAQEPEMSIHSSASTPVMDTAPPASPARVEPKTTTPPSRTAANVLFERGKQAYEVKNYVEAMKWFSKAAAQGDAKAQNR